MIKVSLLLLDANTIWLVGHVGWSGYLGATPYLYLETAS